MADGMLHRAGIGAITALLTVMVPATAGAVQESRSAPDKPLAEAGTTALSSSEFGEPGTHYAKGEVLVEFKTKASSARTENAVRALGDKLGQVVSTRPNLAEVELTSGRSVEQAVRHYRADPRVKSAQPNYIYRAAATPNDAAFGELWGLEDTGQAVNGGTNTSPGDDISAPEAWDLQTDCTTKTVAVLDTGFNYKHNDLAANATDAVSNSGRDLVGDNPQDPTSANDGDPMPYGGAIHGTHVAGTIGAVGNNGDQITGVCWQADLMSVRVLGPDGTGFTADLIEGVDYAVNNGADILNMSLGGFGNDAQLKNSLANARDNGVLAVVSAGNDGTDLDSTPHYPCSFDLNNIVCVAALDEDYALASFSNYSDNDVDVGAPGVNTLSTYPGPTINWDPSSWTIGNWVLDTDGGSNCNGTDFDFLVNPSGKCDDSGTYSNNIDHRAFKEYDFTEPVIGGRYDFFFDSDLADGNADDELSSGHESGSAPGDPFDSGTVDGTVTGDDFSNGDTDGFFEFGSVLSDCAGSTCSIGFRLVTDGSGTDFGAAITAVSVQKIVDGAEETQYLDGTSMASPHVAGIAALAWSVVPDKNYSEIRSAVMNSGDDIGALDGRTTSGHAADARQAIEAANDPPTTSDKSVSTVENTSVDVEIPGNDPNGHSLSYSITSQPSDGSVSLSDGKATYEPNEDFTGADSFSVQVSDGYTGTATSNVSVDVSSSDDGDDGGGGGGATGIPLLVALGLFGLIRRRSRLIA